MKRCGQKTGEGEYALPLFNSANLKPRQDKCRQHINRLIILINRFSAKGWPILMEEEMSENFTACKQKTDEKDEFAKGENRDGASESPSAGTGSRPFYKAAEYMF